MASELDKAIIELSFLFENRYGHLWSGSSDDVDRDSLREKLRSWKVELESQNATHEDIIGTARCCLKFSEHKNYPPNLNSFISTMKEFRLMFSNGEFSSYYLEIKKLDEIFQFTYGGLWSEQDQDKQRRKLEFWAKDVLESGINQKLIKGVANKVRKRSDFRTYPPTLNQFVLECRFEQAGLELGDPERYFYSAINGEYDKIDAIANSVVSIIGTRRLKTQSDNTMKKRFVEIYYQEAINHLENPDKYIKQEVETDGGAENVQPTACPDFFSNLLKSNLNQLN